MYIKLFTALEALVVGFVRFKGRENVFTREKDFEEFRNQLEERIGELLEDMDETNRVSICEKLGECLKECENIFKTKKEFEEFKKQLKKQIKNLLKEDITKRTSIYAKLVELNRYPFETNLKLFLTEHHVEFNDLIDDLGSLIKCRNEIIHSGSIERIASTELIDEYYKLLALIQRIFLSLLKYNGDYYNLMKEEWEQFKKDPNNDVHCSD